MATTVADEKTHPAGATVLDGTVRFRIWAPEPKAVRLAFVDTSGNVEKHIDLKRGDDGYFSEDVEGAGNGQLYFYDVDGQANRYPDPASHFQPQGVHGPSQVVDHKQFEWSDGSWRGLELKGQIDYELHIGTFTKEGTWSGAIKRLPHLRDLGVTFLQIMPVSAFPGEFGWGYDGVFWYAPTQLYGGPDDFRQFVNSAHEIGLGVILDVVYNHLGPCGNYAAAFSSHYFSKKHHTEWGDAINYDAEHCGPVRDFVAENAAYWMREFHLDGLRLDATHAILDDSKEHIVAKLTKAARAAAGDRSIVILSESESQDTQQVRAPEKGGYGLDGLLNDDFHHAARVAATGDRGGYYTDFSGSPQELISAIRHGYLFQGQWSPRQAKFRGSPAHDVAAKHFVHFLQNHDQVANSARSVRTHLLTTPGRHRALTTLLLLGPQTPMLFMGQEFAASNPFRYFADHETNIAELVRKGRREFMAQFPRLNSFVDDTELPDPSDERTFLDSKLNWDECETHAESLLLHRDLIHLRHNDPVFSRQDMHAIEGAVIGDEAFILRWRDDNEGDRMGLFNLGREFDWYPPAEPLLAPPGEKRWQLLWSSEEPKYGGFGTPHYDGMRWRVPGHSAVMFAAVNEAE